MRKVWIVKADGRKSWYNRSHLLKTCRRSGISTSACNGAIAKVERVLKDGMSTKEILDVMMGELKREVPYEAPRYDLKGAIMRLGPAGFHFEKMTSHMLNHLGYETHTNLSLQGKCVRQEVDIVARKGGKCYMIECKFHRAPGIYTGLKEAMYTWARFEDLNAGFKLGVCDKFSAPWLITNTKFSEQAIQYSDCKQELLTGWNHPKGESYVELLERNHLFPITTLRMDSNTLTRFAKGQIMFLRELRDLSDKEVLKRTGISGMQLRKYRDTAAKILEAAP